MAVERVSGGSSLIDVLDRVLDKGIVIDAWVRISLVGIDLITVEARVVVASIDTYLKYADAVGLTGLVSRPSAWSGHRGRSWRSSQPGVWLVPRAAESPAFKIRDLRNGSDGEPPRLRKTRPAHAGEGWGLSGPAPALR